MDWDDVADGVLAGLERERAAATPFGVFALHRSNAYWGINPASGERVEIASRLVVYFIPTDGFLAATLDGLEAPRLTERECRALIVFDDTGKPIPLATPTAPPLALPPGLYDETVRRLRAERKLKCGGFGTFSIKGIGRRLAATVPLTVVYDNLTIEFAPSQVFRNRLSSASEG